MPMVGIVFYQFLESNNPGYGRFILLLPLAFITIGASGFVFINRKAYD